MPFRRPVLLALLPLALAACGDESAPPAPGPGVVTARVVSDNPRDGAAVVELAGGVGEVTASGSATVVAEPAGDGRVRVMVVSLDGGPLAFRVALADTLRRPTARVLEVADTADVLRTNLASYRVEY